MNKENEQVLLDTIKQVIEKLEELKEYDLYYIDDYLFEHEMQYSETWQDLMIILDNPMFKEAE